MKVEVRETTTKEVEVELPIYGGYWDDVADGRAMFDVKFRINSKLQLLTITEWTGDTVKTTIEVHQLRPNEVGQYLKYDRCAIAEFRSAYYRALQLIEKSEEAA